MPLVDITYKPGYQLKLANSEDLLGASYTRSFVRLILSSAIPTILVENAELLGLDPNTPPEGVQVQNHEYDKDDLNVANIWIKIQFSEAPDEAARIYIRDTLYDIIMKWFAKQVFVPEGFVMDLLWGPTNGRGVVDGKEIVW